MRFHGVRARPAPAIVLSSAAACAAVLIAIAPAARANLTADASGASSPTPTPPPTPTPVNAFLSLDITSGGPNTEITVNGGAFLANEQMTLYWDPPSNKVAGGANADGSGNFTTRVKPFSGDSPGVHRLCASVPPFPCANFALVAPAASPSPSPSASPSPTDSPTPSPTAGATDTASPSPGAATINGLDVIMKPPFVILPIIGGLGLLVALGYFVLNLVMRPRATTLKSVAVSHMATRPDYAAGFGTPPPLPPPPAPAASAWADVLPPPVAPSAAPELESPGPLNPNLEIPGTFGPQPGTEPQEPAAPAVEGAATPTESTAPETPEQFWPQPGSGPPAQPPATPDEPPDLPEPSDY